MGPTGAGKSSVSRILYYWKIYSDAVKFQFIRDSVPPGLATNTKGGGSLQFETYQIATVSFATEDGTRIKLVDTPGFDDSREGVTDAQVLKMIATFLVKEWVLCFLCCASHISL